MSKSTRQIISIGIFLAVVCIISFILSNIADYELVVNSLEFISVIQVLVAWAVCRKDIGVLFNKNIKNKCSRLPLWIIGPIAVADVISCVASDWVAIAAAIISVVLRLYFWVEFVYNITRLKQIETSFGL